jgi:5'-methylthioadenosine phosphorylase
MSAISTGEKAIMPTASIAVIGGTGLYDIEGLTAVEGVDLETPFGNPSDTISVGTLGGAGIAFLPRHGRGHRISPTEVNSRANLWALKSLGVEHVISVNSCGSFKEELAPGHLVIPDQIIDRTRQRHNTFFGDGIVAHIQFADPFCPDLSAILYDCAREAGATVHRGGTFIAMEGPAFSTRAESRLYKSWGADVIGMTVLPEARLAREAEMCYASIACVTDYDSWHETNETVTVEAILTTLHNNIAAARDTIRRAAGRLAGERTCACRNALGPALVTDMSTVPSSRKRELDLLLKKYR